MQVPTISSWQINPLEVGPLYPLVGSEGIMVAICGAVWLLYTIWQFKFEYERCSRESRHLSKSEVLSDAIDAGSPWR
jgi:hypothetical protein